MEVETKTSGTDWVGAGGLVERGAVRVGSSALAPGVGRRGSSAAGKFGRAGRGNFQFIFIDWKWRCRRFTDDK